MAKRKRTRKSSKSTRKARKSSRRGRRSNGGLAGLSGLGSGGLGVISEVTSLTEGGHKFICYTKPSSKSSRAFCSRVVPNKAGPAVQAAAETVRAAVRAGTPGSGTLNPNRKRGGQLAKGRGTTLGVRRPKGMGKEEGRAHAKLCVQTVQNRGAASTAEGTPGGDAVRACLVTAFS